MTEHEYGVISVVAEEYLQHRLPTLLALRNKVESGQALIMTDFDFLSRNIDDALHHMPLTTGHPEIEELVAHLLDVVRDICKLVCGSRH